MNKLGKVAAAYLMASAAAVTTGWVLARIWVAWTDARVTTWLVIAVLWLAVVGLPSLFAAANHLLRLLGVKDAPWLALGRERSIPVGVGGNFGHHLPTVKVINPNGHIPQLQVDELEIRVGEFVIGRRVLLDFLSQAWRRQRQYKDGLSRNWWVDKGKKLERGEYEALIEILIRNGLIQGRRPGRSGKLIMPPLSCLDYLEEKVTNNKL